MLFIRSVVFIRLVFALGACHFFLVYSQNVSGKVLDSETKMPLSGVRILSPSDFEIGQSDAEGLFSIALDSGETIILTLKLEGYISKKIPVAGGENKTVELGTFFLVKEAKELPENMLFLSSAEVDNDESNINVTSGILQSGKNAFLARASYDFSPVFFKIKGYRPNYGTVLINGFHMNKLSSGAPYWGDWDGLNDITKNQNFYTGIAAVPNTFGGLLGTTDIAVYPTEFSKGLKVSTSYSNRTYTGRAMVTYHNSAFKRWKYSVSASSRFSKEAYFQGTSYNSYSMYAALSYDISDSQNLSLSSIYTTNSVGQFSAITKEAYDLTNRYYNSYWGYQAGSKRNSRTKGHKSPILMADYRYAKNNLRLNFGAAYQHGQYYKSRLDFINANNPDPLYYQKMPSYYRNKGDLENAKLAEQQFLQSPQIDWDFLYRTNLKSAQGKAVYLLFDDCNTDRQLFIKGNFNYDITPHMAINGGVHTTFLNARYFAAIKDFLGSSYHVDSDPFSNTKNNTLDSNVKTPANNIFRYDYSILASQTEFFSNLQWHSKKWDVFLSGTFSQTAYQRDGHYKNERFLNNSYGKSALLNFSNYGLKAGATYKLSGNHIFSLSGFHQTKAPAFQNAFVNPRDNNRTVSRLTDEKISSVEATYHYKNSFITAQLTGYFTHFRDRTNIHFYYAYTGLGDDFFQEEVTHIGSIHKGLEASLEANISPSFQANFVASIGQFVFSNNPHVSLHFDSSGNNFSYINTLGRADLGTSKLKNYAVPSGPQKAYSLGLKYQNPKNWWIHTSGNYLTENFVGLSNILRTDSFFKNPKDPNGLPFPEAKESQAKRLLNQEMLDSVFLINLTAGKFWRWKDKLITVFLMTNNLLDKTFRSGGYEQSRFANYRQLYQDRINHTPNFGPKYWFGYGRTFFVNLSIVL